MYCLRCEREIPDDEMDKKNEELKTLYGIDSLEKGECPVCGNQMVRGPPV